MKFEGKGNTNIFILELLKRLKEKSSNESLVHLEDVEEIARELAKEIQISDWFPIKQCGQPKETGDYLVSMLHYGHNKKEKMEPTEKVEVRHFYTGGNTFQQNIWEHKGSPFENFDVTAYMPLPEFYKERDDLSLEDKDDLEM